MSCLHLPSRLDRDAGGVYRLRDVLSACSFDYELLELRAYVEDRSLSISVITGGTSGIGREVAESLVHAGRRVVIVGRNEAEGRHLADLYSGKLVFERADLSLMRNVHRLSEAIRTIGEDVDLLVHCAGAHAQSRVRTDEGIELNLAINYLAKFALTVGLTPMLRAAAKARIVIVGSPYIFNPVSFLRPERLNNDPLPPPFWSLVRSGMAVSVWTVEMGRRLQSSSVVINAITPGVVRTNILRDSGRLVRAMDMALRPFVSLSVEQGAAGPLALATADSFSGVSGRFFKNTAHDGPVAIRVPAGTFNEDLGARLWAASESLCLRTE